jgi:hypothetical protein
MTRAMLRGFCVLAWIGIAAVAVVPNRGALAQGPIADPWAPNNYEIVPAPGGGANALGFDSRKWSYWQTQIDPRGNMYGYDARGNYWTYNRRTRSYEYYATEPRWQARCYTSVADFC